MSCFKRWQGGKMPLGLFSTGHSTELGAAVTPVQANHVLEPLHRSTQIFFSPRRSWWHSEHQKALLLSLCLQVKENKSIPVTKLLVKYLSGALVKCLQIVGTAAKLFLVTRWLFPHQWTMIKVEEMVFSFSLDEVLTDNKSFYSTSIDFLVFKHGKQNATRFSDAFLKPPTGTGGIKLIKISFSSLSLLEHLFRWS